MRGNYSQKECCFRNCRLERGEGQLLYVEPCIDSFLIYLCFCFALLCFIVY
jgi:hypothetical protein